MFVLHAPGSGVCIKTKRAISASIVATNCRNLNPKHCNCYKTRHDPVSHKPYRPNEWPPVSLAIGSRNEQEQIELLGAAAGSRGAGTRLATKSVDDGRSWKAVWSKWVTMGSYKEEIIGGLTSLRWTLCVIVFSWFLQFQYNHHIFRVNNIIRAGWRCTASASDTENDFFCRYCSSSWIRCDSWGWSIVQVSNDTFMETFEGALVQHSWQRAGTFHNAGAKTRTATAAAFVAKFKHG